MRHRIMIWILACAGLVTGAAAEEQDTYEKVDLRVTSAPSASNVVVDRGSSDGLAQGDLVMFEPREGGTFEGTVVQLDERSAVVELLDKSLVLAVGTRGAAFIPAARFAPAVGATTGAETDPGEHAPWQNEDEGWTSEMPLLAEIQAVRPENRESLFTGRMYFIGDATWASQDSRSASFLRFGQSLRLENPFQRGGGFLLDMEQNYRTTHLPDQNDEDTGRLRLDRLSYYEGGDRFSDRRWEAGRFLQHVVPEFGLVDGFEYTQRLDNGHSVGGSAGFMPEPFDSLDSGHDFQVAGYYRWVSEASEQLSATGGFQKTFHDNASDRNLIVAKLQYLPIDKWNFIGTAWIDIYTGGDQAKGSGIGLTQAYLSTTRRWENGSGLNVSFNHWEFPDMQRVEFRPVLADQIANSRNDRISLSGWRQITVDQRAHSEIGFWDDQDESGGDAAFGIDFSELIGSRSSTDLTVFGTQGRFSTLLGARVTYGKIVRNGRWDLFYEFAQNDQEGFDATQDNFIQHRLRGSRNMTWVSGWNLSLYAESLMWADEDAWSLGVYLQKAF